MLYSRVSWVAAALVEPDHVLEQVDDQEAERVERQDDVRVEHAMCLLECVDRNQHLWQSAAAACAVQAQTWIRKMEMVSAENVHARSRA